MAGELPKTMTKRAGGNPSNDINAKYSKQIVAYAESTLLADELGVYKELMGQLSTKYNIHAPHELMMLDIAVKDFIRVQRMYQIIAKQGDMRVTPTKFGETSRPHEAHYLLNAIESQFRQNMKELLLTRREDIKQKLGIDKKDFSTFMAGVKEITVDEAEREEKKEQTKKEQEETKDAGHERTS